MHALMTDAMTAFILFVVATVVLGTVFVTALYKAIHSYDIGRRTSHRHLPWRHA